MGFVSVSSHTWLCLGDALLAELEAEKEARVAHIGLMAARRLGQQAVIKAWESWAQEYRTQRRQVRTSPDPNPAPGPGPNPKPQP